jgi:UDP-glucose 4-epimerase
MTAQPIEDQIVLVTGGAGFIGSHICDLLIGQGAKEIRVFDNFSRGTMNNLVESRRDSTKVTVIDGDIRDPQVVDAACESVNVIFHQAAIRITQCVAEPRLATEVLIGGMLNLLESAVRHDVRKIVAASSASVYGQADVFPTTESHHTYNNRTLYGACKIANEGMLRAFSEMHQLPYVALRYFNAYGPRMDVHGVYTEVLIRWLDKLDSGERPVIFGDGSQTMDFVYVNDIAQANLLAMQSAVSDVVFNVASGVETSLRELCTATCVAYGKPKIKPEFIEMPSSRRGVEVTRRLADTSLAKRQIDFEARTSLDQGLRQLIDWRTQELNRD